MLTEQLKEKVKDFLDNLYDETGWKEFVSDLVINRGIPMLDDLAFDKYIPVAYHEPINQVIEKSIDEDYEGAILALQGIVMQIVNIEWFTDENQEAFVEHILGAIAVVIKNIKDRAEQD